MAYHSLYQEQKVNATLAETWEFFSNPGNLKEITPEHMGFDILTKNLNPKMYSGQIIQYKVKPVLGIPLHWVTEIKNVVHENYFVDEQRHGPYKFWHHEHWFEETANGVLMKDRITYALPLGFIGKLMNKLFVRKQLASIFEYRKQKVETLFNT